MLDFASYISYICNVIEKQNNYYLNLNFFNCMNVLVERYQRRSM